MYVSAVECALRQLPESSSKSHVLHNLAAMSINPSGPLPLRCPTNSQGIRVISRQTLSSDTEANADSSSAAETS